MCGLAGFITSQAYDWSLACADKMAQSIHHRGPDGSGVWSDTSGRVNLAHARLAIVDLSVEGHQPMLSPSGRFTMVFNGEVYNFKLLRKELEGLGLSFRGHSDTEVLLNGFEAWGVEATIKKSVGMFAIALWDSHENRLHLIRDRVGEKPLYYGLVNNSLVFSSELKAFKQFPGFSGEINRNSLALMMRHNYIPAPHSIYKDVYKLPAATILSVELESPGDWRLGKYWNFSSVVEEGVNNRSDLSDAAHVEGLDQVLRQSISDKMIADVPLGAFLSGGYDSTAVVALMQSISHNPVNTFSIGFHEEGYNEAVHAKAVAGHLGTNHTELYVTPDQALDLIPRLPTVYDEPFSDSSQIPTYLVSQMTREKVTVALSGDGGDELFGGYNRYNLANNLWGKLSRLPLPARSGMASLIESLSPSFLNSLLVPFMRLLPSSYRHANPGDKLHKLASILSLPSADAVYLKLLSHWDQPEQLVLGSCEPVNESFQQFSHLDSFVEKMMAIDTVNYMSDDILTKVDRASMAVSLETRVPLIDHRVIEYAWRLPFDCKIRNGEGKWILKQVLDRYVPRSIMERPKMGFGVPIDQWMRGELKEWCESLLDPVMLRQQGFFNEPLVTQKWSEHKSGVRNWQYYLWDVLMFQAWYREQGYE